MEFWGEFFTLNILNNSISLHQVEDDLKTNMFFLYLISVQTSNYNETYSIKVYLLVNEYKMINRKKLVTKTIQSNEFPSMKIGKNL